MESHNPWSLLHQYTEVDNEDEDDENDHIIFSQWLKTPTFPHTSVHIFTSKGKGKSRGPHDHPNQQGPTYHFGICGNGTQLCCVCSSLPIPFSVFMLLTLFIWMFRYIHGCTYTSLLSQLLWPLPVAVVGGRGKSGSLVLYFQHSD